MTRIPFSQVLKSFKVDIREEYKQLYGLFCYAKIDDEITLKQFCSDNFLSFPFRKTCLYLNTFEEKFGYNFEEYPPDLELDYLVSFCEYTYNLIWLISQNSIKYRTNELNNALYLYMKQVEIVIETIGYMANTQGDITDFVPKDQVVISVAEIVDLELSYKLIEYNHHSMKGDLERKRATLLVLADKLEAQSENLKHISAPLKSDIFMLLNNINIRHNNTDPNSKNYIPFVAAMKNEVIEHWYDELYQMCLLAFLEMDHSDHIASIEQLKKDIQP